ncbi:MAG: hypothetical protein M3R04_07725, partial [bacterium]|nr:hypothetical protein [bacterium]
LNVGSCMGGSPGDTPVRAYLPYVENIEIPAAVVEGQTFDIKLTLSAQARPEILNGLTLASFRHFGLPATLHSADPVIVLEPWVVEPSGAGTPVSEISFSVQPLSAGTYRLQVETAKERSLGGVSGNYVTTPGFEAWPDSPGDVKLLEQEFTVQPAP